MELDNKTYKNPSSLFPLHFSTLGILLDELEALGYHGDHATRPDAVTHAHMLIVRVLSPPDKELVSHVVSAIVHHEAAALHPARVAPAQVGGHISTIAAGLIGTTLEVPVLIEDDLRNKRK